MSDLWLPFCVKTPGPAWKTGYGSYKQVDPPWIEGTVDHSAEGSWAGLMSVLMGSTQASWTFSTPKSGPPHQHYPIQVITWHAGIKGDRRFDTSLIGNITLRGRESEGGGPGNMGEPWTDSQTYWNAKIDVAMREYCPRFAAHPPTLKLNQWEHRWLTNTSCPSGRNRWTDKFNLMKEMEDMGMTPEELGRLEELEKQVASNTQRRIYIANYEQLQGACADVVGQASDAFANAMDLGQIGLESSFNVIIGKTEASLLLVKKQVGVALNFINNSRYGMKTEADRGDYGLI